MSASESEFQIIHDAFQPKILRFMARMVAEDEAEDLTQEVFVKISRALNTFRGESSLSTWVYRIATNTALDRLRSPSFQQDRIALDRRGSEEETEIEDGNMWTGEKIPPVEHQVFRKEMNECICDFIGRLPGNYRTVLVLSELEGFRNTEISEILGISLETVKIRLHRAREKLKEEFMAKCDSYWLEDNEFLPELRRMEK
ncbi:MAG: sigma-70 family RNA polymerase sigma factor [Chloroflexi bacterium]|nr:sigma-70 family RNA polymerase sigma factor [Chloroflexota bacterium]